jgi:hypothetical protein
VVFETTTASNPAAPPTTIHSARFALAKRSKRAAIEGSVREYQQQVDDDERDKREGALAAPAQVASGIPPVAPAADAAMHQDSCTFVVMAASSPI